LIIFNFISVLPKNASCATLVKDPAKKIYSSSEGDMGPHHLVDNT